MLPEFSTFWTFLNIKYMFYYVRNYHEVRRVLYTLADIMYVFC